MTTTATAKRQFQHTFSINYGDGTSEQFRCVWTGRARSVRVFDPVADGPRAAPDVAIWLALDEDDGDHVFASLPSCRQPLDMAEYGEYFRGLWNDYSGAFGRPPALPEGAGRPPKEIMARILVALNSSECQLELAGDERPAVDGDEYTVCSQRWLSPKGAEVHREDARLVDPGPLSLDDAKALAHRHAQAIFSAGTADNVFAIDVFVASGRKAPVGVRRVERTAHGWKAAESRRVGKPPVVQVINDGRVRMVSR